MKLNLLINNIFVPFIHFIKWNEISILKIVFTKIIYFYSIIYIKLLIYIIIYVYSLCKHNLLPLFQFLVTHVKKERYVY